MSEPTIISYSPRPDATPETELSVLANVFRFVLEADSEKKATRPGGPDAKGGCEDDSGATQDYTG